MNLQTLFSEAHADAVSALSDHGITVPPEDSIYVLYNQRLGRAWGRASKYCSGRYKTKIQLSADLCQHTNSNAILNTMIHEIIHCCGIWNHRKNFKYAALLVNRMFPGKYNVSRCTGPQEKMSDEQMDKTYKYMLECPKCHYKWGYKRFTRHVQHPSSCWCTDCYTKHRERVYLVRTK